MHIHIKEKNPNWKGGITFCICKVCGKDFRGFNSFFCSRKCFGKSQQQKINKICLNCGKTFETVFSKPNRKFCSLKCAYGNRKRDIEGKKTIKCLQCNKEFVVKKCWNRKVCSIKCRNIFLKGKNYISNEKIKTREEKKYKNYIIKLKKKNYYSSLHSNTYRKLINLNETSKCLICSSPNKLVVHHIDGDRKNNNINNLQILCDSCHKKTHNSWKLLNILNLEHVKRCHILG